MGKMNPANFDAEPSDYISITDPYNEGLMREVIGAGLLPQLKSFADSNIWPKIVAVLNNARESEVDLSNPDNAYRLMEDTNQISQDCLNEFVGKYLIYSTPGYPVLRGFRKIMNQPDLIWTPDKMGYIAPLYKNKIHNEIGSKEDRVTLYVDDDSLTMAALEHELRKKSEKLFDILDIFLAHYSTSERVIDPVSGEWRAMITLPQIAEYLEEPISGGNASRVLGNIRAWVQRLSRIKLTTIRVERPIWKDPETGKINRGHERVRVSGLDCPIPLLPIRDDWICESGGKAELRYYYELGDALRMYRKNTTLGHLGLLRLNPKHKYAKRIARHLGAIGFYTGRMGFLPRLSVKGILEYAGIPIGNSDHLEVVDTADNAFKLLHDIGYLWKIPDLKAIYERCRGDYPKWLRRIVYPMPSPLSVAPMDWGAYKRKHPKTNCPVALAFLTHSDKNRRI